MLIVFGLAALIGAAAGIADVAKHGRRMIGRGEVYGRESRLDCPVAVRTGCLQRHYVNVAADRANRVLRVDSQELYDLVGTGDRHVPVQLEIDTFDHQLSRAEADGRWYVIDETSRTALIILIPLAALGLFLIAFSVPSLARASVGWLTADRRWLRWLLVAGGSLALIFCIVLAVVGLTDKGYDEGRGELFGPYASFRTGTAYYEGVHVRAPGLTDTVTTDSSGLYDLVTHNGPTLPAEVYDDAAGKIEAVTYQGKTYRVGSSDLLALVVVIPLGLLGLALAWLNGRALWRNRVAREAPLAS